MLISTDPTPTGASAALTPERRLATPAETVLPPAEASVLTALAAAATRTPDALALEDAHTSLTHDGLHRLTRALGTVLDERLTPDDHSGRGVGPEQTGASVPVGVMVAHGVGSVTTILGLVHAGRTVVALDPFLPEARLQHVVSLAGIVDVVADAEHHDRARALVSGVLLSAEAVTAEARERAASDAVAPTVPAAAARGGQDPLDIIFTSGSTGAPKGVVMTHRQALVDMAAERTAFRFVPGDRVASVLPHGFAAGFMLVLSSLSAGASVHLADPRKLGIDRLATWVRDARLTTLHTTPHLVRSLVGGLGTTDERLHGLRLVATVGEAVTGPDVVALRPLLGPTASFCNWTGSSETNVYAVNEIAAGEPVPERSIPSGHIVAGKRIEIRRPDGTLADVGESGAVVCVSDAMTSGYWGAPDVTATRAGTAEDGTPTWSIGDLGRFDEDGKLTLLGRADDAVKVRGYLVEPSEVEAALRTVDAVREAAVIAVKAPPAPTRLVAYVVASAGRRSPSPAAIRKALRELLPDYMVPTAVVPMPALPRNERGKVDRAALPPAPAFGSVLDEDGQPLGEDGRPLGEDTFDQWELAVGLIWAEVLGLPTIGTLQLPAIGLDDDFSALGGDSLSAEEMLAAVDDRLGVDLPSAELLEHPTLRAFAARIRRGASASPSHPDVVALADRSAGPAARCSASRCRRARADLRPLTRHLADHPVYAFQQHGIERRAVPDWSVAAMARRYIELMRIAQPSGPYTIVGHSFGGIVALEMAAVLTAAGQEVERVVLLDTYLPGRAADQAEAVEFGELDLGGGRGGRPAFGPRTRSGSAFRERVVAPLGQLGRRGRAYGAGMFRWAGQRQFRAFFDHALIVSRGHRPSRYEGPVTLVVADGNEADAARWAPFLVGEVDEVRMHCEHNSVLREPHVATLAAALEERFAADASARG